MIFADDWIRTADHLELKATALQLSHNNCPWQNSFSLRNLGLFCYLIFAAKGAMFARWCCSDLFELKPLSVTSTTCLLDRQTHKQLLIIFSNAHLKVAILFAQTWWFAIVRCRSLVVVVAVIIITSCVFKMVNSRPLFDLIKQQRKQKNVCLSRTRTGIVEVECKYGDHPICYILCSLPLPGQLKL